MVWFWHKESPFSNFYPCEIEEGSTTYNCVEQFFTAEKARTFKDSEALHKIMSTNVPSVQKSVRVKNYSDQEWNMKSMDVMYRAVKLKFEQNPYLKEKLLETGSKLLVEASPFDRHWGVGISMNSPDITNRSKWGENRLGKILMEIRADLK